MKDVNYKDYGKYYEIDEYGHVWSKERNIQKENGIIQHRKPKELSWCKNSDGYPTVKLSISGCSERIAVHRLVALTFIDNPMNLQEVNHIDLDRWNPFVENLEWLSHKDNVSYSYNLGMYEKPQFVGSCNPKAKKIILEEYDILFGCVKDCAEYLIKNKMTHGSVKNASSQIIKVCKGIIPHYLGYKYRYV